MVTSVVKCGRCSKLGTPNEAGWLICTCFFATKVVEKAAFRQETADFAKQWDQRYKEGQAK